MGLLHFLIDPFYSSLMKVKGRALKNTANHDKTYKALEKLCLQAGVPLCSSVEKMPQKRRQFYRYWQVRAAQRTDLTLSEGFAEVLKKPSLFLENLAAANSPSTSQRQPGCVAGVWARLAASLRAARGLLRASCCAGRGEVVLGSQMCCQHPLLQYSVALCRGGCFWIAGQA